MIDLSLSATSDLVSEEHVIEFARNAYGLVGSVQRLGGEKDDNFVFTSETDERYLVKVSHPYEDPKVVDLQTFALEYLQRVSPELPVQRVVRSLSGSPDVVVQDGPLAGRSVRVTSYLEGTLLRSVESTSALRREIGVTAALLGYALKEFNHSGASRPLLWDLSQVSSLRPLTDELPGNDDRNLLATELDRFITEVIPRLGPLRTQAVHNDLSTDNLLVSSDASRVTGILDFGDLVHTQLVNDVAIAASYQLSEKPDPTNEAIEVVAGYHATNRLSQEEISLLPQLIAGRVLIWNIIPKWRSAKASENNAYVLRNADRAWSLLLRLRDVPFDDFAARMRGACERESAND
jgi:hydroxylysine kinase